jgi:hypothetical protein
LTAVLYDQIKGTAMGNIANVIAFAFRFYETDGVPLSGINEPQKADIIAIGPIIEANFSNRSQRAIVTAADLPVRATDQILNINAVVDLAPLLPLGSTLSSDALTFKNLQTSVAQTLVAPAGKPFDGNQHTYNLAPGGEITLRRFTDGVNDPDSYALA